LLSNILGYFNMLALMDFFAKPVVTITSGTILRWWESRRLYFNAIIFGEILILTLLFTLVELGRHKKSKAIKMPASVMNVSFLYLQLPANIVYTGGWLLEVLLRWMWPGMSPGFAPWALRIGIGFSVAFVGAIMSFFALSSL